MNLERRNSRYSGNTGLFDEIFKRSFPELYRDEWQNNYRPFVNISEHSKQFKIELVAPGFKRDNFQIEMNGEVLVVKGDLNEENREKDKQYTKREYCCPGFERRFLIPENLDEDKIEAKYEDGILHLILPKKELKKVELTRTIQVK